MKHNTPHLLLLLYLKIVPGTYLAVQWLRLRASTAGDVDSIPRWGN